MLQLFENGRNFGRFPTMFPLDWFWCGFGRFPTIYCVCWKTAEISAVFQQCLFSKDLGTVSAVFQQFQPLFLWVVGKRPKFRPFSNKHSRLFENGRNFGRFPTTPNVSAVFQQLCFGRFPTTVFGRFPTNFRPFYS